MHHAKVQLHEESHSFRYVYSNKVWVGNLKSVCDISLLLTMLLHDGIYKEPAPMWYYEGCRYWMMKLTTHFQPKKLHICNTESLDPEQLDILLKNSAVKRFSP